MPPARPLWKFAQNPHAHAPPVSCHGDFHGVRNAYWMAFTGLPQDMEDNQKKKRELRRRSLKLISKADDTHMSHNLGPGEAQAHAAREGAGRGGAPDEGIPGAREGNPSPSDKLKALIYAAEVGAVSQVRAMLKLGAEIDGKHPGGGGSNALMYASLFGHGSVVKVLLAAGADPTLTNGAGAHHSGNAGTWGLMHSMHALGMTSLP